MRGGGGIGAMQRLSDIDAVAYSDVHIGPWGDRWKSMLGGSHDLQGG